MKSGFPMQGNVVSPLLKLIALFLILTSTPSVAERLWYPFAVEVPDVPGISFDSNRSAIDYVPMDGAKHPWKLCVSFPHMKDSYWLAVNFGVVNEVKRMGVKMRLFQAGGYDKLTHQIQQIRQCVDDGADGVVIGAISYTGLDELVAEIRSKGIPVIDVINGMSSEQVSARSLVSFEEMGYRAGEYIAQRHPKGDAPIKVAWFPGPEHAGWVKVGDTGFKNALSASSASIVETLYGDTGKQAQTKLLEKVLDTYPDLDYIAGTAVTAAAATKTLRLRGMADRVKVVSYYFTPEVYRGIKRGLILAAPTDSAVIQGRIAVDQVVRILERQAFYQQVGPHIYMIDKQNINTFDRGTSLAPSGFRASYSTNIRLRK